MLSLHPTRNSENEQLRILIKVNADSDPKRTPFGVIGAKRRYSLRMDLRWRLLPAGLWFHQRACSTSSCSPFQQALALEPRLPVPSLTKHGLATDSKQCSRLATLSREVRRGLPKSARTSVVPATAKQLRAFMLARCRSESDSRPEMRTPPVSP